MDNFLSRFFAPWPNSWGNRKKRPKAEEHTPPTAITKVKTVVRMTKESVLSYIADGKTTDKLTETPTYKVSVIDVYSNGSERVFGGTYNYFASKDENDANIAFEYMLKNNGLLYSVQIVKETELK